MDNGYFRCCFSNKKTKYFVMGVYSHREYETNLQPKGFQSKSLWKWQILVKKNFILTKIDLNSLLVGVVYTVFMEFEEFPAFCSYHFQSQRIEWKDNSVFDYFNKYCSCSDWMVSDVSHLYVNFNKHFYFFGRGVNYKELRYSSRQVEKNIFWEIMGLFSLEYFE